MSIILNIGLARNDGKPNNKLVETLAQLDGYLIDDLRLVNSRTEPTLVVELPITTDGAVSLCQRLCVALAQDCVAVYSLRTASGTLIGPAADKWGPFDLSLFYLPEGIRIID